MATNQELFELILRVQGKEQAEDLKAKIALTEQKIASLWATMKNNPAAFQAAIKNDVIALNGLNKQLNEVQSKLGSTSKAGQALNQIGYAVDDLQFGFKGISNNIQPILQSIPGLSKLAGPISIAVIAAYQLYEHWDKVMELFGQGIPQPALTGTELLAANLKKAEDRMEELARKTRLTWYKLAELNKLRDQTKDLKAQQKDASDLESVLQGQSTREQEVGSGFKKALDESGGTNARDELAGNLSEAKDGKGLVFNPVKRTLTTPKQAADDLVLAASRGDEMARSEIKKNLKLNSTFLREIDRQSPETKEAEKKAKEQAKAKDKAGKEYLDDAEKSWDDQLKQARKSRSWATKAEGEMTPAELLAKDEFDQREVKIADATRDQSWLGKEDEELSPEEKIGKKRFEQGQRDRDERYRNVKESNPELGELIKNSIRGGVELGGMDLGQAQSALYDRLKDTFGDDITRRLVTEAGVDAKQEGISAYLNRPGYQSENATVINGASALRDSIQGSVKSPELDELQKLNTKFERSLEYLNTISRRPGGLA